MKDTRTILVAASTAKRLDDLRYEGRPRNPRSHNEVIVGLLDEVEEAMKERFKEAEGP